MHPVRTILLVVRIPTVSVHLMRLTKRPSATANSQIVGFQTEHKVVLKSIREIEQSIIYVNIFPCICKMASMDLVRLISEYT